MLSVLFSQYVADEEVKLVGVEAAGHGLDTDKHAATMTKGSVGIVDGMKTYAVFKEDGELAPVYSISAGLDYPGLAQNTPTLKIQVAWNMWQRQTKKLFKPCSFLVRQKGLSQRLKVRTPSQKRLNVHRN